MNASENDSADVDGGVANKIKEEKERKGHSSKKIKEKEKRELAEKKKRAKEDEAES